MSGSHHSRRQGLRCQKSCWKFKADDGRLAALSKLRRLRWMRRFRMVIVQVQSQMVSN